MRFCEMIPSTDATHLLSLQGPKNVLEKCTNTKWNNGCRVFCLNCVDERFAFNRTKRGAATVREEKRQPFDRPKCVIAWKKHSDNVTRCHVFYST